jgi:hypothetical protein
METYRVRTKKLITLSLIYSSAAALILASNDVSNMAWMIYGSTLAILYAISVVGDALYLSLRDLQQQAQVEEHDN